MKKFTNLFKPQQNVSPVSEDIIEEYKEKVPQLLIDLWRSNGHAKYNNGVIELINPKDFEPSLWTWLGREVENYVPFAISGFGELFYYRKLTETDEDVCMIDIQYRKIETIVWGLESFFEDFLTNEEDRKEWLREDLFNQAITEQGVLIKNEIFTFTPVLAMGGGEEVKYLKKGNAQVYQDIVFQMTM
ncbi:T6SS immunity protein Tdi1 domain-containing protein [Flavivirga eckloniae]|uniref:DUF1851 domain-containing protein n=1 Tax=Flavivirga eckloniae TaxID=1803846 RepID=A0A2K9PNW0_9FLAO|nr:T6SS immunity protein Tdi1 domain-containing protein [Flavivirga eckloniae]AUP78749.1 hypothetical protein C1H87_08570 [Flavivirga eckloniae]